jgi:hypothetical protein
MTSDDTNTGAQAGAPGRRFSSVAVIGAGLVGLVLGAIATFAVTGLVWTVRVQLPPPPYPPPLTSNGPGCIYQPPSPGVVPMPPLPPVPHAQG